MGLRPITSAASRSYYLPRLKPVFYQADAIVHWEMTVSHRSTGWLSQMLHCRFREIMVHTTARYALICPVYCLMPDHLHLVWMGLRPDSDQLHATSFLRTFLKHLLAPAKFQHQAFDHVLRDEERRRNAFAELCTYILANPTRKGLVAKPEDYPFSGAILPGYPSLNPFDARFWPRFWDIYVKSKMPEASMIKRPIDRLPGVKQQQQAPTS